MGSCACSSAIRNYCSGAARRPLFHPEPFTPSARLRTTPNSISEVSPALRFEAALEDAYELCDRGSLGPEGPIDMEACQAHVERYADEIQLLPPEPAAS